MLCLVRVDVPQVSWAVRYFDKLGGDLCVVMSCFVSVFWGVVLCCFLLCCAEFFVMLFCPMLCCGVLYCIALCCPELQKIWEHGKNGPKLFISFTSPFQ